MKKILITGANSYIGTSFEKYLKRFGDAYSVDTVDMIGDGWKNFDFSGYDSVFHVAGIVHCGGGKTSLDGRKLYYAVNTDLTIDTARRAKAAGVGQFVFMSSASVYGSSAPVGKKKLILRDTPLTPLSDYGKSKAKAEEGLFALEDEHFKVVVLRPPMTYGKGCKGNYRILSEFVHLMPFFPYVNNCRSMIYIDNLSEFIRLMVENNERGIFFPQNKEYVNTSEMVRSIRAVLGRDTCLVRGFGPLLKLIGLFVGAVNKVFGNFYYDKSISRYKTEYCLVDIKESIYRTEGKCTNSEPVKIKRVFIVNSFEHNDERAEILCDIFRRKGFKVSLLTSDWLHIDKEKRSERRRDERLFHVLPYYRNLSPARLLSHFLFAEDIRYYLTKRVKKGDLLWVIFPPNSFVRAAAKLKFKDPQLKIIFDIQDLWSESVPAGRIKKLPPFAVWRGLRDKYLYLADCVVTECSLYQEVLKKQLRGIPARTIYLARKDRGRPPAAELPQDKLVLCYLGSINNIIDIDVIAQIIEKARCPVILHLIGKGVRKDEFIEKCRRAGAEVINHEAVYDRDEKQKIFRKCHYGLNIMRASVCVGLTLKSMDYFECGLPLINNIRGDTWDAVEKYKIGINYPGEIPLKYDMEMRERTRFFFENELTLPMIEEKVDEVLDIINR